MFYFIAQAAEPVINGLDVVKAVDDFYQHAWLMLTVLFALFGSLIVIVMPLIMQRIQSSSFNKAEKRLKDEIEQIKKTTQESVQETIESTRREIDEIQKDLVTQIDNKTRLNRGEFYSILARLFSFGFGQHNAPCICHLVAASEFAFLKHYGHVTEELDLAISTEFSIHVGPGRVESKIRKEAESFRAKLLKIIDEIGEILEAQGVKDQFSEQLAKVRDTCTHGELIVDNP